MLIYMQSALYFMDVIFSMFQILLCIRPQPNYSGYTATTGMVKQKLHDTMIRASGKLAAFWMKINKEGRKRHFPLHHF